MTDTTATPEVTATATVARPLVARPVVAAPLSRTVITPGVFGTILILVTIVPFVSVGIQWLFGQTPFFPLQSTIALFATIHVPLTAYLLFDRNIREMMWRRPIGLIVMPTLIFAGCFVLFIAGAAQRQAGTAAFLVYFQLFVLAWNLWHFGKQNIGVYSFYRISQSRSRMLPIEKRLMMFAAGLGALTTFGLGTPVYIKVYAANGHFDGLLAFSKYAMWAGTAGQLVLLAVAVWLVIAQRARHGWQTALLFLVCTNYFIPQYLFAQGVPGSFVFACNTLGHGLQYCTFLGFHAGNDYEKRDRSGPRWARYLMPAAFLLTALFLADFYVFQKVVSVGGVAHKLSVWLGSPTGLDTALIDSITIGILLNHFWLDSFFWRFQDPQSRNWMLSRFSFLFGSRPAASAAS
jgi:hypothetical protein